MNGHRDRCFEFQHIFRHGRLKTDGSEKERQCFGHRHFANGEGNLRIVQHLFQQSCFGADHAIFATNENQVVGKFEIIVTAACKVASEDWKYRWAKAADCLAKTGLDVGIDFPKGGKDHALELKALGYKNLRALKRPLINDRLLFNFREALHIGAG